MMNERSVHVYASGRGFVVVPACQQPDGTWVECQPAQHVSLMQGRAVSVYLGRAINEASAHRCTGIQLWNGMQDGWWKHHHLALFL